MFRHHAVDRCPIGDVAANEDVAGIVLDGLQGIEIAGVGQIVEVHDAARLMGDALPNETTADKPGPAGD